MGRDEVFQFLKKQEGIFFSSRDISKGIDVSLPSVIRVMGSLRTDDEIITKNIPKRRGLVYAYRKSTNEK